MNRIVPASEVIADLSNGHSAAFNTPSANCEAAGNPHHPAWTDAAPEAVASATAWDDASDGWLLWLEHLQQRKSPRPLKKLFPGKMAFLTWGLGSDSEITAAALESVLRKRLKHTSQSVVAMSELATTWLTDATHADRGARYALDALAWAYHLPDVAPVLSPAIWWSLVEHLTQAAQDALAEPDAQQTLAGQLLAAELPMVLAARLPELTKCQSLQPPGQAALRSGVDEILGESGLPHASLLPSLRPLLACWTRTLIVADSLSSTDAAGDLDAARTQFGKGLHAAVCLMRRDGTQLLEPDDCVRRDIELFEAAAEVAGSKSLRSLVRGQIRENSKSKPLKKSQAAQLAPSLQSDAAEVAVLRTDWSRSAVSLAVCHDKPEIQLELHVAGASLFHGAWPLEVAADGRRCRVKSAWENVCWVVDDDAVYFELQAALSGGVRVQRQMLLARREGFLFLADAIISDDALHLDYCSRLPLTTAMRAEPPSETRELKFQFGKRVATAMPLSLPEWRQDPRGGTLSLTDHCLEMRQSRPVRRLFAPLWIDFDKRRRDKPLTWRQLTVAEDRQPQSAEVAVGYRVQVGSQQWIIYRSLAERANRTLLGSNLVSEFMLARFTAEGEVEPLVEIE